MKTHVLSVALASITLVAAFIGLPLSQAAWPDHAEVQPDNREIERLVKKLGSDNLKEREEATKRLTEIGEPALDALAKATSSLEVPRRAEAIVVVIENKLYVEQLRLIGHTDYLDTVSVSGDGKRLLTGSNDKTLRLWDADTGKQLRVFEGHTGPVRAAALSLDGKRLLSTGDDRTVRLWDAATGMELHKPGPKDSMFSVALGPKGRAISGSSAGKMRLWDLNTPNFGGQYQVAYRDKANLAATFSNHSIRLWNAETGKEGHKLTGLGDGALIFCLSANGKRLASANSVASNQFFADIVRVWDVETGEVLKQLKVKYATCIALSPDGKRIVTGCYPDGVVRVWDIETGKELRKYEGHTGSVFDVAYFPDGKRIVSVSFDRTARIWRAPR
jgi:WD40 repeat protein